MHADSDDLANDDPNSDDTTSADGSPTTDDVNQSSFLDEPATAPAAPAESIDSASPQPVETGESNGDYVVLARKYRPQNFDQLIGQEALVQDRKSVV